MMRTEQAIEHSEMPFVSIIIVNWNGALHLRGCLESLHEQTYKAFEVIVVDNGSVDDSVALIREQFPWVSLVCLEENRGFTGGNWAGYRIAQGSMIALLNNDTHADKEWLKYSVSALSSDSDAGICACTILIDGTDKIDSVGDIFTSAFSGTKVGHLQSLGSFDRPKRIYGGCGAAIMYRRSMLDAIGFLDDDFYFNHEDTDLNLRAWLCGWKCVSAPDAVVHHKVSATVGELSDMGVYHFSRNTVWVWLKNTPLRLMIRFLPQRIVYELSSAAYFCGKGRIFPYFRGKLDALKRIRCMLKKRRSIQQQIIVSQDDIRQGLLPIGSYLKSRLNGSD